MKQSAYRYKVSFVDTATDKVEAIRHSYDIEGVKRQISRYLAPTKTYDNTGRIVIYIFDEEFFTPEGRHRLDMTRKHEWIDNDVIFDRGIDFDIWHDHYLSSDDRKFYDILRVH